MNKISRCNLAIIVLLVTTLLAGCKKDEVPIITTTAVSNITATSATSGGNITDEGSSTVITRGVCWSTGTTPTIEDNKTTDGSGSGNFTSNLSALNAVTNYSVRAYATNSVGTGYGMVISFTTLGQSPTPVGAAASNVSATSARLNGSVNANYLSTVVTFEYGITSSYGSTISATQNPLTGNTITNVSADISNLTVATLYHYRIKAENSLGVTISDDFTFTTLGKVPTALTLAASNISLTSVTLNGSVNANDISTVVTFEYGTSDSYGSTVTATQSPITGNTNTNVTAIITGLSGGTTYHFRVKAANSLGISYGSDLTFIFGQAPTVTTFAASNVNLTGASMNGSVNANYLSSVVTFEYGTTNNYGSNVTATQSPVTGNTNTNVGADISGLNSGTTYHYRIKATNSIGTSYGSDLVLKTIGDVPIVTTLAATNINLADATLNGTVNANFLSTNVTFEYGKTTSYGSSVTATQSPVNGNTNTNVGVDISGLEQLTTYHYRIKATNSLGTSLGTDMTFITKYVGTVTDVNGNIYNTLSFGTQVWMKENLRTINYANGDLIGTTTPATLNIYSEITPKYQWAYGGDESNVISNGRLYTWYAATDIRKVCPTGWHVPSDAEWTSLTVYLTNNGYGFEGSGDDTGKSMATTSGWTTDPRVGRVGNDQSSNNSSGFSAYPSGIRIYDGLFTWIGDFLLWWSSTDSSNGPYVREMSYGNSSVTRSYGGKSNGSSIRCLRD